MKILLISYYFPPANVIGAVRVGKLAKYLHEQGHDVRVLTAGPSVLDTSLKVEIPEEKIIRTRAIDFDQLSRAILGKTAEDTLATGSRASNFLSTIATHCRSLVAYPDGQVGWLPFALSQGARLMRQWQPDLIYASASPVTSFLVARRLGEKFQVPWIGELRDLWTDNPYYQYPAWRRWLEKRLEKNVFKSASAFVTISEPFAEVLRNKHAKPTKVILNGFDPEDFPSEPLKGRKGDQKLHLLYTGLIYPGKRDPSPLFEALQDMGDEAENFQVDFYGRKLASVSRLASDFNVARSVEVHDPVSYKQAIQLQAESDVLLLLLWNSPAEKGVFSGKLFEYLGARRPILLTGYENGVAADLVRQRKAGFVSNNADKIAEQLRVWLKKKHDKGYLAPLKESVCKGLSRYEQFSFLEIFLEEVRASSTQRPANIIVVCNRLTIGGTECHLLRVLPYLDRRRFLVSAAVLHPGGVLESKLIEMGIPIIHLSSSGARIWRRLTSFINLIKLFISGKPDLVHFFLPESYILGGVAAAFAGVKTRVMSRRSLNLYQKKYLGAGRFERWLHGSVQALLGNSAATSRQLREEGALPEKVGLIYNGIDVSRFDNLPSRHDSRSKLGIDPDAFVMVITATLIDYKGHADLFKALGGVRDYLPKKWVLLCVGRDEGMEKALRHLCQDLKIDGNVRWLGERDDIPLLLSISDIGVLSSHEEGFSNSILEYMGASLPVVATSVGGNKEAIIHEEAGYIVPPRDPTAMGRAILRLSNSSPDERRKMGNAGRGRVEQKFSLSACVESYEHLYGGLLKNGVRPVQDLLDKREVLS